MSFNSLGLSADLVANVTAKGYRSPTPIQQKAIPAVIAGKDILAGAQTGTGKTAAFALPIIQEMVANPRLIKGQREIRCLVITPTRELAAQVGESFQHYSKGTGLQTSVVFGGVGQNPQVSSIRRGIDILVATPGRLLDLNQQGLCPLKTVEILVLDEADRMLDMGFIHDIRKIIKELPYKRQNLLFSATYTEEIRRLASNILIDPVLIDVAPRNAAADQVTQSAYSISKGMKRALLSQLIRDTNWYQVLVFTRTKHGANRLAKQLGNDGIPSAAIHGNKSQSARTKALASFKKGDLQALVATDIAARGLDIKELPCVVNFELPNVPEDYVHRIGRTGRAGKDGLAISLFCHEEEQFLKDIERLLKKPISRLVYDGEIEILQTDNPSESEDRRGSGETDRVSRQRHGNKSKKNAPPTVQHSPNKSRPNDSPQTRQKPQERSNRGGVSVPQRGREDSGASRRGQNESSQGSPQRAGNESGGNRRGPGNTGSPQRERNNSGAPQRRGQNESNQGSSQRGGNESGGNRRGPGNTGAPQRGREDSAAPRRGQKDSSPPPRGRSDETSPKRGQKESKKSVRDAINSAIGRDDRPAFSGRKNTRRK